MRGVWWLQYFEPLDRVAFRRLLRAEGELERFYRALHRPGPHPWRAAEEAARDEEYRRLLARIAELSPLVGWRRR